MKKAHILLIAFLFITVNLFISQSFFTVPHKVYIKSVSYKTDEAHALRKSKIVQAGQPASVSYQTTLFSTNPLDFHYYNSKTSGSASLVAKHKGYLYLAPRYKIINYDILVKSRRPLGHSNPWVYVSSGSTKKIDGLVAIWHNVN